MNLPLATNIRTLSISEIPLTSLLDEHLEDQKVLEDLEDQKALEGLGTLTEDQTTQGEYSLLISFLYNPQET